MPLSQLLWSFKGRIGRGQFWKGVVVTLVATILLVMAAVFVDVATGGGSDGQMGVAGAVLLTLLIIASTVCQLALNVKRYHDRGKSGWWVLIALVPLIGSIWLLVELGFLQGDPGPNDYGPDPLASL